MQNTSNADLDADLTLAMMWKEDVREEDFGWCLFGGNFCMDTFYRMTQNTKARKLNGSNK